MDPAQCNKYLLKYINRQTTIYNTMCFYSLLVSFRNSAQDFLQILLFIFNFFVLYFWLSWVFLVVRAFSSCSELHTLSGFSVRSSHRSGSSCCPARALGHVGFRRGSTCTQQLRPAGSRPQARQLCCRGLVSPWHVGSSQVMDRTRVPGITRQDS